jgi:hypothetical protein
VKTLYDERDDGLAIRVDVADDHESLPAEGRGPNRCV